MSVITRNYSYYNCYFVQKKQVSIVRSCLVKQNQNGSADRKMYWVALILKLLFGPELKRKQGTEKEEGKDNPVLCIDD